MQRLYYLANDLHVCELIAQTLKEEGIGDWNFHVVSKDGLGLYQHGIHAATAYQELDVVHTGERWGLAGLAIGLGVGALLYLVQPLPWAVDGFAVALIAVIGALFGCWQGALAGLNRRSYKIRAFEPDLEARRHLVMVDVRERNLERMRELMNERFPSVEFRGGDSPWISPFGTPRLPAPEPHGGRS
ncbi:MAG TPA: hypothetical protein VF210_17980 [Pseudomonadales bacterium]